jgi:hypothetical protein
MTNLHCGRQDQFLFPLRKERDEKYERLIAEFEEDECDTLAESKRKESYCSVLTAALTGDVAPVKETFYTPEDPEDEDAPFGFGVEMDYYVATDLEAFYNVCLKIKNLEAKLYDEAMKGEVV